MPLSQNIHSFEHVRSVLDAALVHETAAYTLSTDKAAVRWRMEAYHFRVLAQRLGIHKYDSMILKLDGSTVTISRRVVEGVLKVDGGEVAPKEVSIDDATESFAFELAKKLGLETEE